MKGFRFSSPIVVVVLLGITAAVLVVVCPSGRGWAQGKDVPYESENELIKAWEKERNAFYDLSKGKNAKADGELYSTKKKREAARAAARYQVLRYRVADIVKDPTAAGKILKEFSSFEHFAPVLNFQDKNQEFLPIYIEELLICFEKLLPLNIDNPQDRLVIVNYVQMFPWVARTRQEKVGDFLVGLIPDKKDQELHDVVKLYALKGLAEFGPARAITLNDLDKAKKIPKKLESKRAADLARVRALENFLVRPIPKNMEEAIKEKPFEAQAYLEAYRFVRRECIRALAAVEIPAVDMRPRNIHGAAVYSLLRVLPPDSWHTKADNKNGLYPLPSLTERLEAALGILNLKFDSAKTDPSGLYRPELGIYLAGLFLADFIDGPQGYRADFKVFFGSKDRKPAILWKVHAERLKTALKNLQDNASKNFKDNPDAKEFLKINKKAQYLADVTRKPLEEMAKHERIADAIDRTKLDKDLRPTDAVLFKDIKSPNFLD